MAVVVDWWLGVVYVVAIVVVLGRLGVVAILVVLLSWWLGVVVGLVVSSLLLVVSDGTMSRVII